MEPNLAKFNIEKIVGSFVSALEHQWVLILDAKSAHEFNFAYIQEYHQLIQ